MPDNEISQGLQELWQQLPGVIKSANDKAQAVISADPSDPNGEAAAHAQDAIDISKRLRAATQKAIQQGHIQLPPPTGNRGPMAPQNPPPPQVAPSPSGPPPSVSPAAPVGVPSAPMAVAPPSLSQNAVMPPGGPVYPPGYQPPVVINVNNEGHKEAGVGGPEGEVGQEGPAGQAGQAPTEEMKASKALYDALHIDDIKKDEAKSFPYKSSPPDFLRTQGSLDRVNEAKNLAPNDSDALVAYAQKYYGKKYTTPQGANDLYNDQVQKALDQLNAIKFTNAQNAKRAEEERIRNTEGGENVGEGLPTDIPGATTQYGDDPARTLLPGELKAQQAAKDAKRMAPTNEQLEAGVGPFGAINPPVSGTQLSDIGPVVPPGYKNNLTKEEFNKVLDEADKQTQKQFGLGKPGQPAPEPAPRKSMEKLADHLTNNPNYQTDGVFDPYKMVEDFSNRAHLDLQKTLAEWDAAHGAQPHANVLNVLAAFFAGLSRNPEAMRIANQWHDDAVRWDDARNKFVEAMGGRTEQNVKLATEFANRVMETESRRQEAENIRTHQDALEAAREKARAAEHELSLKQAAEFEKNKVAHEEDVQNRMDVREGQRLDQEYQRQQAGLAAAEARNKENILARATEHDKQIKASKEYQNLNLAQKAQYQKLRLDLMEKRIGVSEFNAGLRVLGLAAMVF